MIKPRKKAEPVGDYMELLGRLAEIDSSRYDEQYFRAVRNKRYNIAQGMRQPLMNRLCEAVNSLLNSLVGDFSAKLGRSLNKTEVQYIPILFARLRVGLRNCMFFRQLKLYEANEPMDFAEREELAGQIAEQMHGYFESVSNELQRVGGSMDSDVIDCVLLEILRVSLFIDEVAYGKLQDDDEGDNDLHLFTSTVGDNRFIGT